MVKFMEFSRQEYWSGLSLPPPGTLPDPGIKPMSPCWTGRLFTTEPPGKPAYRHTPRYIMLMSNPAFFSSTTPGISDVQ